MSHNNRNNQLSNLALASNRPVSSSSSNSATSRVLMDSSNNAPSVLADSGDLSKQKPEALMQQFDEIGHQAQIMQGQILIELQNRANNQRMDLNDFIKLHGIKHSTLCALTHQHRNRLMNLAKFFNNEQPMTGISATVGYEISAPKNKNVALQVYAKVVNQNCSVKEIRELIKSEQRALNNKPTDTPTAKISYLKSVVMTDDASKVIAFMNNLQSDFNP